jgi:hypothetical protein
VNGLPLRVVTDVLKPRFLRGLLVHV